MSIPKIIHYCWFGGGAISPENRKCMESWKPKPSAVSHILQRLLKKHYYTWYCPLRGRIEGRLRKRT